MKALAIQPARGSQRATLPAFMAAVTNLKSRIDARVCLTVAIAATVCLFACLGAMCVPGIVVSGLTALTCAAVAPIDKDIEQEGGKL